MMGWRGEQALERMVGERIRRFVGRCRGSESSLDRLDNRKSWYTLGFKDGWEQASEKLEMEPENEVKRTERKNDKWQRRVK
jgi:hypothetical protein